MNGIWELPFGHGRRWGSDANPLVNGLIGNWSVSVDLELAVGTPEHQRWATSTTTATSPS